MNKVELVFIPSAGVGHLVSMVEIAKLLISRNEWLSITVLTMKLPFDFGASPSTKPPPPPQQAEAETSRIRFVELKPDGDVPTVPTPTFLFGFISMHKTHVRDIIQNIVHSESTRLAGFVIDMFCTSMIDVANEFGLPTYVFFTSGAGFLGLMLHLQTLRDHHNEDITEFKDSDAELAVPSFENPVPAKVLPSVVLDKEGGSTASISIFGRLREAKGIMVNTFTELEPYAVKSLSDAKDVPPVYTVGPILDINSDKRADDDAVLDWLDDQPKSSVLFLCFGSRGSFDGDQVKEIAYALERSGHRFLWTAEAVVLTAEVIESGIKKLMDSDGEIRKKVEEMKERSRMAVAEGGASYVSLGRFIEEVMGNIQ
ncbi:hypothetical protein RJ639_028526 [Escallonia herrerae]|uniref:Uncharacterized protein n=1 Tax=Escallonia herrerae TaxID=1293975 RepID=A0AA89BED6_9ASTE|nr:hypothetical protein RJ639_028526 [Escallonia herrerae]